ncbi:MAG: hypothetical protein K2I70_01715 [Bacilli bacterium]|nr:hypothetical protein [Bacilli bacterium]
MNEKVFYVASLENEETYAINISDINILAAKALSLELEEEVSEALGYAAALETYYRTEDDELKKCYSQLTSDRFGKVILCTTISLSLLEQEFRKNGINDGDENIYNSVAAEYQRQLDFNKQKYGIKDDIAKAK